MNLEEQEAMDTFENQKVIKYQYKFNRGYDEGRGPKDIFET